MKILVGFEKSGIIREAFRKRGHDAWSCDLLPSDIPGQHLQMDIYNAFDSLPDLDLIILHPPCTCLSVSGNHVYAKGKTKYLDRLDAIEYTQKLWDTAKRKAQKVCLENPVGVLSSMAYMGVEPQYIQPWQFGHPESKKTGLWLYNLPELKSTNCADWKRYRCKCGNVFEAELGKYGCCDGPAEIMWDNQTPSGQNKLGPSKDRARLRAVTYAGIAEAMANQWSDRLTEGRDGE